MTTAIASHPGHRIEGRPLADEVPLVVFAGGGTGGHLFPVLAVAEALGGIQNSRFKIQNVERGSSFRFAFFGSSRAMDREVIRIPDADFVQQSVRPVSLKPWTWPGFYRHWASSRRACRSYFERVRPAIVVGSGGYASGPPICEAARAGIPTLLLNPDARPGLANRYLSRHAGIVCVQWAESASHFPRSCEVVATGCPVRAQFVGADRAAGMAHFRLAADRRTLLVTGASQGAASINSAILALADDIRSLGGWQILHLAGSRDAARTEAAYAKRGIEARVVPFTDRMADAMAAADLIVSRAGASTLAEITAMGKASVLLPYPFDRRRHQRENARMLSDRGAAHLVEDRIDPGATLLGLRAALMPLMADGVALDRMAAAARRLGAPDAAERVGAIVRRVIGADAKNER